LAAHPCAGTSKLGWRARALDPIDFEKRDGVPYSGWPFDHSTLQPYYLRAREYLGLDAEHDDVVHWANQDGENNLLLHGNGLHSVFFLRADKEIYRQSRARIEKNSKQDLITFANVVALEVDETARRVSRAVARTTSGVTVHVEASDFVLAAGGIGNARLLLASNATVAQGLGNAHDLVGRFFMEHPHLYTGFLELSDRALADRMAFYTDLRNHSDMFVEGMLALPEGTLRDHALPNAGFFIRPTSIRQIVTWPATSALGALGGGDALRSVAQWRSAFRESLRFNADMVLQRLLHRHRTNRLFQLYVESEQVPDPASRVGLSLRKDEVGMPEPKLEWRLGDHDFATIRRTQELLDAALRRRGIGRLYRLLFEETPASELGIGNHQMGTTRMGDTPQTSVVDADGLVHGIGNLYVTGSSVFPTGGSANPTLTIIALALRLADTLAADASRRG
jgi:choline dehydrogenase-like flavoprotein